MPYRDVITTIKQNMLDSDYYKKTLVKYQTADILLIDDLFKGKITEADTNIVFEIINYRYLNKLPVIISSEHLVEKLLGIDEAIGSRIYEMCKDFIIEIEGKENNYRLKQD
jgi:DNA replication protein DnaC